MIMYVQIVIVKHKAAVATLYPVRNKTLGVCPADNGVSNGVNFIRIVTPPLSKKAAHVKKARYTDFSTFICTRLVTSASMEISGILSELRRF